jgi:hypothetical protein
MENAPPPSPPLLNVGNLGRKKQLYSFFEWAWSCLGDPNWLE